MLQRVGVWGCIAIWIVASGCLQSNTVRCGDLVCPQGFICHDALDACVRPAQIAACDGKAEDAECSFEGAPPGRCVQGVCASAGCGNQVLEIGEMCDDGNIVSGDGCSSDCRSNETCGNGLIDTVTGEACDDSNTEPLDGCQPNCELPTCGDGIVDPAVGASPAEICDDGNNVNGDGCNARCTSDETCQNGVIDPQKGEDCDDDNAAGGDGCSAICKFEICGNGSTDVGEVCDDGNNISGDDCSANCKSNETCGNGIPDLLAQPAPELCDEGGGNSNGANATCRPNCQPRSCGDGIVDNIFGESCEMGVAITTATCQTFGFYDGTLGCTSACAYDTAGCTRKCGDGIIDADKGEECDSATFNSGVTCQGFGYYSTAGEKPECTSICKISTATCSGGRCGDSTRQSVEVCEGLDLNGNDCTDLGYYAPTGLVCNAACGFDTNACSGGRCGDHIPNGPEYCDGLVPANTCADLGQDMGRVACSTFCTPNIFGDCSKRDLATESSPTTQSLRDVWAIDNGDMFAVGDGGTILHFNGLGWSAMASNTAANLDAVWGSSGSDVYAVGAGGVVMHYDGSAWAFTSIGVSVDLRGVHGTGPNDVWIVGGSSPNAKAVHWDGAAWTASSFSFGTSFEDVWTPTAGTAFAVGYGGTVQRFAGGTWTKLTVSPTSGFLSVFARSATDVYVAGGQGTGSNPGPSIQHFDGTTWTQEMGGNSTHSYTGIVGTASEVMSIDYDSNASVSTLLRRASLGFESVGTSSFRLWAATITPAGELVAVGDGGTIQRVSLFTRPLIPTTPPPGATWYSAWASSDTDVFIVGAVGAIRRRLDGAWVNMTSTTTNYLYGLWGADATHLFAAGANGTVLRWDGTGTTWTAMTTSPATTNDFLAIWGTSTSDVFAVGQNGMIFHYDGNASNQWVSMASSAANTLTGISGSGPNDVYAVGSGVVQHYTGGVWVLKVGMPPLRDVAVRGVNDVFAVGGGGGVLRSTDGGATWQTMTTGTAQILTDIDARGPRGDVWAVGYNGTLLHFDDERWTTVRSVDSAQIWDSVAIAQSSVFVFGLQSVSGVGGYELRHMKGVKERCGNEWDDDADGLHDCADSDCAGDPYCQAGGACTVAGTLSCASPNNVIVGNSFTGSPFPDEYACSLRTQNGPEASYRFTATASGMVTAALTAAPTNDSNLADLDVIVLEDQSTQGCDPMACVGSSPVSGARQVTFSAVAGQAYQIVVDGALGAASTFTLTLTCL
jgi:cysteine-rich repeat protein